MGWVELGNSFLSSSSLDGYGVDESLISHPLIRSSWKIIGIGDIIYDLSHHPNSILILACVNLSERATSLLVGISPESYQLASCLTFLLSLFIDFDSQSNKRAPDTGRGRQLRDLDSSYLQVQSSIRSCYIQDYL